MRPEPEEGAGIGPAADVKGSTQRGDPAQDDLAGPRENRTTAPHQRIAVEGAEPCASSDSADDLQPAADMLPVSIPASGSCGAPIVPSQKVLETALTKATTLEALLGLDKALALLKEAAEQFRATIDEAARIAVIALTTKRRIGAVLLQVDRRGGDRAKSHDATLLAKLLQELGKDKARRYRQVARIPEERFRSYLAAMAEQHAVPTEAGVARHARQAAGAKKARRAPRAARSSLPAPTLSRAILDAVERFLGEIDVCIGDADLKCRQRFNPDLVRVKLVRGNVFVAGCEGPGDWLPKLLRLRESSAVSNVVVALPPETGAVWFKRLAEGKWHCFFPTGDGALLAYHGPRTHGFALTFGAHGTVMCACRGAVDDREGPRGSAGEPT